MIVNHQVVLGLSLDTARCIVDHCNSASCSSSLFWDVYLLMWSNYCGRERYKVCEKEANYNVQEGPRSKQKSRGVQLKNPLAAQVHMGINFRLHHDAFNLVIIVSFSLNIPLSSHFLFALWLYSIMNKNTWYVLTSAVSARQVIVSLVSHVENEVRHDELWHIQFY